MPLILEPNDPTPFTGAPSFAELLISRLRESCTPKAAPYPNQAKVPDSSVDTDLENDLLPEMEPAEAAACGFRKNRTAISLSRGQPFQ